MTKKNPIVIGTFILTASGFLTRIIGFFNRIYLSQLIGAKELGIYQLIFPVYMISYAICCHGIELALSQMIAAMTAKKEDMCIKQLVFVTTCFSMSVAGCLSYLIFRYATPISLFFFNENSLSLCLKLMSPVLPFSALRSCMHGYFLGKKKTFIPASGQLIEQISRVSCIWLLANIFLADSEKTAVFAVMGMVAGEIIETTYTLIAYRIDIRQKGLIEWREVPGNSRLLQSILHHAIPLTGNKLSLTIISSIESILIPAMLRFYYQDETLALSMYGVLTGMVLPFILFPATITNSLGLMLIPAISEANANKNQKLISQTVGKTIHFCLCIGIFALFLFFYYGKELGSTLFHNESAGDFLFILSFLCPFLYLSSTCASILNGFGQTKETFFYNLVSLLVRILFLVGAMPRIGMQGYLLGLLAAHLLLVFLQIRRILFFTSLSFDPKKSILIPALLGLCAAFLSQIIQSELKIMFHIQPVFELMITCTLFVTLYFTGFYLQFRKDT